jgi:hypothetical protein
VLYSVWVINNGVVPLTGVTITSAGLEAMGCTNFVDTFDLDVGQSNLVDLCLCPHVCTNKTTLVTVAAAVDSFFGGCGFDFDGNEIVVVSQCDGIVECERTAPGRCSSQAGGRQLGTATYPAVTSASHGGSINAPIDHSTAFDPDSQCIEGSGSMFGRPAAPKAPSAPAASTASMEAAWAAR